MPSIQNSSIQTVIDVRGKQVTIPSVPNRIVSFICSITESLFELGAGDRTVGRTNYCIYPKNEIESVKKIGGPKDPDLQTIIDLNPDLIIANIEENEKKDIDYLEEQGQPVYVTYPRTVQDSFELIKTLGIITGTQKKADEYYIEAKRIMDTARDLVKTNSTPQRIVYLIWRKPYMTINKDTYISNMIEFCGGKNIFKDHKLRYPEISIEDIIEVSPDMIFLSTEPYPFKQKHVDEFLEFSDRLSAVGKNKVKIVDGELFGWYGIRMIKAIDYACKMLIEREI